MHNISWKHADFNLDSVEFSPNEIFRFLEPAATSSFGFFGLGGGTIMLEGAVVGRTFTGENQWCENNADLGWSNDDIGHSDMLLQAGPEGAKWICISRNGTGDREIQHLHVDGAAEIPAGWGFVVAKGTVSFEQKNANQFQYARPRQSPIDVIGTADLLLVR